MQQEINYNIEDNNQPVTVLGKIFSNDDERRQWFRNELRKKLPELKKMEGFPIGEDEDIIELSNPPYYTACPNPWLNDFITEWEKEKKELEKQGKRLPDEEFIVDEPYAADVSEGKNNPIYMAHSYHTKVPHPAIMRYIMHYTQPGDIIFDGFAGTGMTGVAASMCHKPEIKIKQSIENENHNIKWGKRNTICGDLSPIATFISNIFSSKQKTKEIQEELINIIEETEKETQWMYEVKHNNKTGFIDNVVWSDVFLCSSCQAEIIYWDAVVDYENQKITSKKIICQKCNHKNKRKDLERKFETVYDPILKTTIKIHKSIPVLIKYSVNGSRFERKPNQSDLLLIEKINNHEEQPFYLPRNRMIEGSESRRNDKIGLTHSHLYYTKRNLLTLGVFNNKIEQSKYFVEHLPILTASIQRATMTNRFRFKGTGGLSGTLYVPSLKIERAAMPLMKNKYKSIYRAEKIKTWTEQSSIITTQSATDYRNLQKNSIDYIFTDPPFGSNINYSELNFISEEWLKVYQDITKEAIENPGQNKSLSDYINLITLSFSYYYYLLKPGKWMTVEFSNTSAAVWNGIQTAIHKAGFIVANVSALDKKQETFKAVNAPSAVKQDLVISCYKPSSTFNRKFSVSQHSEIGVWNFIEEHLIRLPVHVVKDNATTAIIERSPKILFDRLIAFYVTRSLPVPIDARLFQEGLKKRFLERDGMFFNAEQAEEYDRKKAEVPEFVQLSLFVASEQEAIYWLRQKLEDPKTESDLHKDWMTEVAGNMRKGDKLPEMRDILTENFLQDSEGKWYIPDMENEADLERVRTRKLLRTFDEYKEAITTPRARLREVRVEALREGFKKCYQDKDFETIIAVGNRIPNNLLMEDEVLLQYYDIASSRV